MHNRYLNPASLCRFGGAILNFEHVPNVFNDLARRQIVTLGRDAQNFEGPHNKAHPVFSIGRCQLRHSCHC